MHTSMAETDDATVIFNLIRFNKRFRHTSTFIESFT